MKAPAQDGSPQDKKYSAAMKQAWQNKKNGEAMAEEKIKDLGFKLEEANRFLWAEKAQSFGEKRKLKDQVKQAQDQLKHAQDQLVQAQETCNRNFADLCTEKSNNHILKSRNETLTNELNQARAFISTVAAECEQKVKKMRLN